MKTGSENIGTRRFDSSDLFSVGHDTSPFMTCESGGGEYTIKMKFKTLEDAQKMHTALCDFFSANKELAQSRREAYMYNDLDDFEETVGYKVNEAFATGFRMARMKWGPIMDKVESDGGEVIFEVPDLAPEGS